MGDFPAAPDESASLDLVGRIQDGDAAAWNDLYRRYHDQLLLVVRMRLGRKLRGFLQSEDVFQSVALDALSALQRFEYRGPGSLQRFLNTMVVNKIRDRADTFGAAKRADAVPLSDAVLDGLPAPTEDGSGRGGLGDAGGDPGDGAGLAGADGVRYLDGERYERLERALAALPDDMREIVLLRKVDGLSSQEVAALQGKSDAAVRKATSRAMARLTTLMTGGAGPTN